jgi:hypothetical protein
MQPTNSNGSHWLHQTFLPLSQYLRFALYRHLVPPSPVSLSVFLCIMGLCLLFRYLEWKNAASNPVSQDGGKTVAEVWKEKAEAWEGKQSDTEQLIELQKEHNQRFIEFLSKQSKVDDPTATPKGETEKLSGFVEEPKKKFMKLGKCRQRDDDCHSVLMYSRLPSCVWHGCGLLMEMNPWRFLSSSSAFPWLLSSSSPYAAVHFEGTFILTDQSR